MIGKEIALQFANKGGKVTIIDVNEKALVETVAKYKEKGYDNYTKVVNVVEAEEVIDTVEGVSFGSCRKTSGYRKYFSVFCR
ncbi:3-hydroxyacyl-CoA dehydrogenase NAD-binding domain-containing protein [Alkalihalobacillus sp. TS-13]|uniref:3-hydroxyacyl-CoA dehydrogenase NAD-binding domain-containing protein n=1 Tax=Alkalihalobacillus sp. TS-13 TaxID=2842455 RepID=UPI001C867A8E|nr:3-hydroxyacyl-CoA dehydrogenase NAD-binding domain-containing protein [Alkalihalobacillus sp. TS-13]